MKVRDLMRALRALGCTPVRRKGSHETWKTPGGKGTMTLTVHHPEHTASPVVLASVRRALATENLKLGRE